ncbi:hypothetical protein PO467_20335 [Enterobacter kobei]|uniref:hypothetical protein n=1 Tax=Enterobacter TaxID=547 RepID=UPI0010D73FDA|nr:MULTISPECIES: hypothetical protein [Enterobacter]TAT63600.1 hypothetical protein EGM92_10015 [Enterobacter cloacae]DAF38830.1 MAG TPA: InsA C-terminal domain [Caudoviricetes sp.]HBV6849553.1 hypothetical protein [Klebsiella pneumoniae]ELC0997474.1 hypothetical protein [Enterobacter kobei]MCL5532307.1 hypothetical protein [Enterobacter kobei]
MILVLTAYGLFLELNQKEYKGIIMKMTIAKTLELAPKYFAANAEQKKELLKEYGITRNTFYVAIRRYNLKITTSKTLA